MIQMILNELCFKSDLSPTLLSLMACTIPCPRWPSNFLVAEPLFKIKKTSLHSRPFKTCHLNKKA